MNNRIEYEKRREKLLKNVKKHEIIMKYNEISKDELFNKIYNGFNIRLLENKVNLSNNNNNNNIYNNINNIENNNNFNNNKNKEEEKEKERIRNEQNLLISYNKTNLNKSNKNNKNNNNNYCKNNYTNYNFLKEKQMKKNSRQKFNYNNKILNTMMKKSSSSSLFNKNNNEKSISTNSNNNNVINNNNKLNYYLYLQNDISNRLYDYGKYINNKINLEKNKFNKKLKKNFSSSFMLKTSNKILQKNKSFIIQRNNKNKNSFSNDYTFSPKINKNSIRIVKNSRNKNNNNNFCLYKNNSFNINTKHSNNNNKINEFYETVLINNKIREKITPIKNEEIEEKIPERIKDLYINGTLKYTNKLNYNNSKENKKIINNNNIKNKIINKEIIEKFNDYYLKQKNWKDNINNNNENLRKKKEEDSFKQYTFSPKINNSNIFDFNIPKDYDISNINYIKNRRENLYKNEDYESKKIINNFGSLKYEFFSDYNNNIIKSQF